MTVYFPLDINKWAFSISRDLSEVAMDTPFSYALYPSSYKAPDLRGRIALVAGATRGTGRGIALALGEAGATVYCTGRSTHSKQPGKQRKSRPAAKRSNRVSPFDLSQRPETIEETAEMVTARGGRGIPVVVDHTQPAQVEELVARIY